jgi:hypothetical protein
MQAITTIGLDIAKFRSMALMLTVMWLSGGS